VVEIPFDSTLPDQFQQLRASRPPPIRSPPVPHALNASESFACRRLRWVPGAQFIDLFCSTRSSPVHAPDHVHAYGQFAQPPQTSRPTVDHFPTYPFLHQLLATAAIRTALTQLIHNNNNNNHNHIQQYDPFLPRG